MSYWTFRDNEEFDLTDELNDSFRPLYYYLEMTTYTITFLTYTPCIDLITFSFICSRVLYGIVYVRACHDREKVSTCLSMHNYSLSMLVTFDIYYIYYIYSRYIYICVCACIHLYEYMRFCVTVLCVYMYVCMCVCTYTYTYNTMMFILFYYF